jgi:hypothetical protein
MRSPSVSPTTTPSSISASKISRRRRRIAMFASKRWRKPPPSSIAPSATGSLRSSRPSPTFASRFPSSTNSSSAMPAPTPERGLALGPKSIALRPPAGTRVDGPNGHRFDHHHRDDGSGFLNPPPRHPVKGTLDPTFTALRYDADQFGPSLERTVQRGFWFSG